MEIFAHKPFAPLCSLPMVVVVVVGADIEKNE
jgi:hypothetical protein